MQITITLIIIFCHHAVLNSLHHNISCVKYVKKLHGMQTGCLIYFYGLSQVGHMDSSSELVYNAAHY